MLQTKYECSSHYGLSEDFLKISCKIGCAWAKPKYDPRGIILTILVKGHPMMLHKKYECSLPYGLLQKDF